MRSGADLNAFTSVDQTIYNLEITLDDEEILSKPFKILEDWAR